MKDSIIRIEKIIINGIKNVRHGEIILNEYHALSKGNFNNRDSILGLYGQNGSGKTTVIEVMAILKDVLRGKPLSPNIENYINNETLKADLEYTFYIDSDYIKAFTTYMFTIDKNEDNYDITYEKMVIKIYDETKEEWGRQSTLFESQNNEVIFKTLKNKLSEKTLMELNVRKDVQRGTSLFFNEKNNNLLKEKLAKKNEKTLIYILSVLKNFSHKKLIIIENDKMGSKISNRVLPINVYLKNEDALYIGGVLVDLLDKSELPLHLWHSFQKIIDQIDLVLNALVPSLHIKITNDQDMTMENGDQGKSFEIVSIREDKSIPLEFESEGIKRIISVTSALIAAYNHPSMCVLIDEFDSGIFEYLLGEILEIFEESAKGQLIFTSHNLRALEKLSYKSIIFTTTNPMNRYIRLKNIKPNNNIRDVYYSHVMLGGLVENLYDETKNHVIKKALRKAGKMGE